MIHSHINRFDRGEIRGDAKITDEGYIRANAVVTRTGIFQYRNADGTVRRELRHPDDVWLDESIASMEMIPVTNGHPQEKLVTAENAKRLAIGYTGESIKKQGDFVLSNFVITDADGVNYVTKNNRKELSLGYTVDLVEKPGIYLGEPYDARQTNIKYNHLAIVDKARAGSEARIALDGEDAEEILIEGEKMSKRKIKIDDDEMMLEASVADYVEKLEADLKNLMDERDRVEAEMKDIKEKLDVAEAEKDSMKSKMMEPEVMMMSRKMDSSNFDKAVKERVALYKVAEKNLEKKDLAKLDGLTDLEIKKCIIASKRKSICIDGKSDTYIQAMYDTILDDIEQMQVKIDSVSFNADNQNLSDIELAQQKMKEKLKLRGA